MATEGTLSTREWKEALVRSFEGFSASQVSQHHVESARQCISNGGSYQERYTIIPFERILKDNQQLGRSEYLTSMISAFDLLLKFVINLLKPNHPLIWRSIKTDNTTFRARVARMKGHEDILRLMGYTELGGNSLQFPECVIEPEKSKLYIMAAELLMAKIEVEQLNEQTSSASSGSLMGYQSQYQDYREHQDIHADTTTTSPVAFRGQHPKSKPHHDTTFRLPPNVNDPTTCTLSATPASYLSISTTLTTTTVESSISSSTVTVTTSGTDIVKSENVSGKLLTASSDISEHESVLQDLRRRRLELKQQREQSSRKTDSTCHLTSSSIVEEIISPAISTAQPPMLVHPHYSDENSRTSGHVNVDSIPLPKSSPVDPHLNIHMSQPQVSTMISSGPDMFPSSIYSNSGPKMETISTRVPATSSSESSTSPGKTNLTQKKTESDIANPDYLLMREEERWKPETASTDYPHMDIPPNHEQKFRHEKSEKSHKDHANEFTQAYYASGMLTAGVQHIQEDGKQQVLTGNKDMMKSEEPFDSESDTESVCSTLSASSSVTSSSDKAKVRVTFPPFITTKQLYSHFDLHGFDETEIHIQRHKNRRTGKHYGSATVIVASQPAMFISNLNNTLILNLHKLKAEPCVKGQRQERRQKWSSKQSPHSVTTPATLSKFDTTSPDVLMDPCRVFVGSGLPPYINEQHIREHFQHFADEIVRVDTIKDKITHVPKGYFFITFKSQASADMAIQMFHKSFILGEHKVKVERQRSAQPQYSGLVEAPFSPDTAYSAIQATSLVVNLSPAITDDEIKALIGVPTIAVVNDEINPQRRYIQFHSHSDAITAQDKLNGKTFLGQTIQADLNREFQTPSPNVGPQYHHHQNLQNPEQQDHTVPQTHHYLYNPQQQDHDFSPEQFQQRRHNEEMKLLQLQPEQWNQLMIAQSSGKSLYQEIISPFKTNPNVAIKIAPDSYMLQISGIPAAVSSAYEHIQSQLSKDLHISDRIKMEALVELYPRLPEELFSKYGVTLTGFSAESSVIHFEGTASQSNAWAEVNKIISSAVVSQIEVTFPLSLLRSLRKCFSSSSIPVFVKPCQTVGLTNQVIVCSFDKSKLDEAVRIIYSGPAESTLGISQSDIGLLVNDQCMNNIEEEMCVSITIARQADDEKAKVVIYGFYQNDAQEARKRLLIRLKEKRTIHRFEPEQVMYLQYQHEMSPHLFVGIPIEFRRGMVHGSSEAIGKLLSGPLLSNLQWKRYQFDCFPKYEQQIIRSVLRPLKEKNPDFVYLVDKPDMKTGKQSSVREPEHRRFDIIVYSKNPTTFSLVCASLNDINPMSKRYSFKYRESVQHIRSIKSKLESAYLVHISENERGARINGLKPDDVQKCWEEIDEEIKSSVVIMKTISFTEHESKFLKEKYSEHLKIQFSCNIFYGKDHGKLCAKGKVRDIEALESKISEILESGVHSETFTVSCRPGQFMMWSKWWTDVKAKQEGSQIMIKFFRKDKKYSGSGPGSKLAEVEFDIIGTDKYQILEVKEALSSLEVEERRIGVPAAGATALLSAKQQGKLKFMDRLAIVFYVDKKGNKVELTCPRGLTEHLDLAEQEIKSFIGDHASVQRILTSDEPVVSLILCSKSRSAPYLAAANSIAKDHKVSVHVSKAQSVGLRLTGNVAAVDKVKPIINLQVLKKIEEIVQQKQLVINQKQSGLLNTREFSKFESYLKEEYCVICSYPKLGKQAKAVHSTVIQPSSSAHPVQLDICQGDIVQESTDAIVNAANENLEHAGGLAKAILDAGGPDIQEQSNMHVQYNGKVFPGTCVLLGAGALPCKRVIHAVGPRWVDGSRGEEHILYLTVYNSLMCACEEKLKSIAFPAIGTGIFQVPEDVCAKASLEAVQEYFRNYPNSTVSVVRFVLFTPSSLQSFSSQFKSLQLPSETSSPSVNIHSKQVQSSNQWLWVNDSGSFSAYPPDIITWLNKKYQQNPQGSFNCRINKNMYTIDFSSMTQINVATGHKRSIRIESSSLPPVSQALHWEYANDQGSWSPYQPNDSQMIEAKYQMNSPVCTLNILGQMYRIDFINMCQVNVRTSKKRRIRQAVSTAPPLSSSVHGSVMQLSSPQVHFNSHCTGDVTVVLRGPGDCLPQAKQKFEQKLKSMFKSHSVTFPSALERKLCQIIQKYDVSSSVRNVGKVGQRKPQKVFIIEGLALSVDHAIAALQEAIIQNQLDSEEDDATDFPPEWERQAKTTQVFQLRPGTQEFNKVATLFHKTLQNSTIIQIIRIQNKWQWGRYVFQKKRLGLKNNGMVNELELFHGTRSNDPKIIYENEDGFDMRYSAQGMWGQANYFAVNASYSHGYAHTAPDGSREMFLVKVLTGDSYDCSSDHSLRKPPMKASGHSASGEVSFAQVQYDTVTGVTHGSRVYMTYDNDKAYPAYLIKYR